MTQLIWDAEYGRNELDHHWTTSRLADEFFLCLCLNKKYYEQANNLMFKLPLTEQFARTEEEGVPFVIDFEDLSPKVQEEFLEYSNNGKRKCGIFLKQVVIRLFENLDFDYAHTSVMKKLCVELRQ